MEKSPEFIKINSSEEPDMESLNSIKDKIVFIRTKKGLINYYNDCEKMIKQLKKDKDEFYTEETYLKCRIYHMLIGSSPKDDCVNDDLPGGELKSYIESEIEKINFSQK